MRGSRENRFREREVFRVRDLEVAQAALHDARRMARPFDRARLVGQVVPFALRAQDSVAQHADAKHLRRLRLPQRVARLGARDRVAARRHALERIGDRQREDAAHRIVLQRRDQRADQRRRDAGARGVVHEHPVLVGRAELGEPEQPVEYRRLTRAAAAAAHREAQAREAACVEMGIVGRKHDERLGELAAGVERGERVMEKRATGQRAVLLRHGRTGAAARAGAGNQGKKSGCHERRTPER